MARAKGGAMRLSRLSSLVAAALLFITCQAGAATEMPFEFRDGMIWVKVSTAGRSEPLNFLLDSGASMSVLDVGTARRLGTPLGARQIAQGVNGHASGFRVRDFIATAGGVEVPRNMLALDLAPVSAGCHRRIDGLLGADFFRDRIVQIDYAARRIRFLSRAELPVGHSQMVPLAMRNGAPCVQVSVNGNAPAWTRVDTGCNSTLQWVAKGSKAAGNRGVSIGVSSRQASSISADIRLGATLFDDVRIGVHSRPIFTGEAGLLGNGLLKRFSSVTFDLAGKRLLLRAG